MSKKIPTGKTENGKILQTKWDESNPDQLTRADFYSDSFQPRSDFLIPARVTYPNERSMMRAMNAIQKGLRHGGVREWRIFPRRSGARVVRLVQPQECDQDEKSGTSSRNIVDDVMQPKKAVREADPLQRRKSSAGHRSTVEGQRTTPSNAKKVERSIFTVQDKGKYTESHRNSSRKNGLVSSFHGVKEIKQYTQVQLQKILEDNKRFFQANISPRPETPGSKRDYETKTDQSKKSLSRKNKTKGSHREPPDNIPNDKFNCSRSDERADASSSECSSEVIRCSPKRSGNMSNVQTNSNNQSLDVGDTNNVVHNAVGEDVYGAGEGDKNQVFSPGKKAIPPLKLPKDPKLKVKASSAQMSLRKVSSTGEGQSYQTRSGLSRFGTLVTSNVTSSHAVNQRRKNREIDSENNRLSNRLDAIKAKPTRQSLSFRTTRQEQLPFARIQKRLMQ